MEEGPLAHIIPEEIKVESREENEKFRSEYEEASMAANISMLASRALGMFCDIKQYGDGDQSPVGGKEGKMVRMQCGRYYGV